MKMPMIVVGMLLTASVAQATSYRHIPDPIAVGTSDLVIVGKVTAYDTNTVARQLPHSPAGLKILMPSCKVTVDEVIFDRLSWETQGAKREPQPPQNGDVLTVVFEERPFDGDDKPKVGTAYALILNRLPGGDEWHVRSHPAYRREAKPDVVAALKKAADLDNWGWGKETNGLRLALMVGDIPPYRAKEGQAVPVMMAVRNMTKRTGVCLNCNADDELFSARGVAADGSTVTVPFRRGAWATDADEKTFRKLGPGQVGFITPNGARDDDYVFHLPLPPGKAKLQVIYESKRVGYVKESPEHKGGPVLWKGKLSSAEVDIELPTPKNERSKP